MVERSIKTHIFPNRSKTYPNRRRPGSEDTKLEKNHKQETVSSEVECWVYVGHPERQETHRKPTKRYMEMVLAGTDCLPNSYVEMLRQVETLY